MEQRSVIVGIVVGFVAGMVVVAVGMGAVWAIDELQGTEITEVSVTRLNATHAAVAWTTAEPTYGAITVNIERQSGPGMRITLLEDSAVTRTHLVVAPMYELNRSRLAQPNPSGSGPITEYEIEVTVNDKTGGYDPSFATIMECTFDSSRQNRSGATCNTVV